MSTTHWILWMGITWYTKECRTAECGVRQECPSSQSFQPVDKPWNDHAEHDEIHTSRALLLVTVCWADSLRLVWCKRQGENEGGIILIWLCALQLAHWHMHSLYAVFSVFLFFFFLNWEVWIPRKKFQPLTTLCLAVKAKGINRGCSI